jgi:hypothetical protein
MPSFLNTAVGLLILIGLAWFISKVLFVVVLPFGAIVLAVCIVLVVTGLILKW